LNVSTYVGVVSVLNTDTCWTLDSSSMWNVRTR